MTEEEKSSGMEELKSEVKICLICKVGKVGPVTRTKDKVDLVIYGRNVMRLARHVESRCRVHGCRAGYYYGCITYKQGPTGRTFQLRVGSGSGIGKNYRVGSGLGSGSGIGIIY